MQQKYMWLLKNEKLSAPIIPAVCVQFHAWRIQYSAHRVYGTVHVIASWGWKHCQNDAVLVWLVWGHHVAMTRWGSLACSLQHLIAMQLLRLALCFPDAEWYHCTPSPTVHSLGDPPFPTIPIGFQAISIGAISVEKALNLWSAPLNLAYHT